MIYIQSAYNPTPDLFHARIGWQNLSFGLTPTASSAASGRPAIAATLPTTYEFWEPTSTTSTWALDFGSAQSVDYVGLVGEFAGATINVQSSTNNSTWTTRATAAPSNRINMFLFASISARYWRLSITGGIPKIAVVYIGQALAMERRIYRDHSPLTLSRNTTLNNNMSERGQYLGRAIIREGASTAVEWRNLTAAWYRNNFDPFSKAARNAPFFIAWRPTQYTGELGFVWLNDDIRPVNTGPSDFMAVGFECMGLINE